MAIFLTGSTGYIGAVAANLLRDGAALNVLVRAREGEAEARLWQAMQLHLQFPQFYEYLQTRVRVFRGDLTESGFGLGRDEYDRLVHTTDSVIHCAASLNRKSEKSCLNVNLRGTLEVLTLARHAEHYHGLRRFSQVSTVAVAGKRQNEVVSGGSFDRVGAVGLRSVCADEEILRAHDAGAVAGNSQDNFPSEHCAGRQPLRGDDAIRHGEGICISGRAAGVAVSTNG
jgi:thioester reductase-like protein